MTTPRILVIGRDGQVAKALSLLESRLSYTCCPRAEADLTVRGSLEAAVAHHQPQAVVNAGGYTAVDRAEQDVAAAFAANAEGPAHLAEICAGAGIPLVHLSSDYVFDGAAEKPYEVEHPVSPIGIYGRSKVSGEEAVRGALTEHVIVRTAWLFSQGGQNFLTTMLRLASERPDLGIVDDQTGSPTFAGDLAKAIDRIVLRILDGDEDRPWGTYHVTNSGTTTWYGLAREIFRVAGQQGYPTPKLRPITTADYPTPAGRPAYSVLDTSLSAKRFGIHMPSWQDAVKRCIEILIDQRHQSQ